MRTALAVGAAIFLFFGAPVILSGEPTFAGYVKLDDTATFLAFTDRVLDHGRDLDGLAPSSYEATLAVNVANGYPLGAVLPLGIGARLVGTDPAWVWQPYPLVCGGPAGNDELRPGAAASCLGCPRPSSSFGATSSALFYGYAQWGGIKELVAVPLLAVGAATIDRDPKEPRQLVLPAVAFAAFLGVMSLGGLVWVAPVAARTCSARGDLVRRAFVGLALLALLSLPVLDGGEDVPLARQRHVVPRRRRARQPRPAAAREQVLGMWPTADFRLDPGAWRNRRRLLLIAAAPVSRSGLVMIVRAHRWDLVALVVSVTVGAAMFVVAGSPWLGGKSLAMASPIVLLVVLLGFASPRSPHSATHRHRLGAVVCRRCRCLRHAGLPGSVARPVRPAGGARGDREDATPARARR